MRTLEKTIGGRQSQLTIAACPNLPGFSFIAIFKSKMRQTGEKLEILTGNPGVVREVTILSFAFTYEMASNRAESLHSSEKPLAMSRQNTANVLDWREQGRRYLAKQDSVLRPVIARVGACTLKPIRRPFAMLVRAIISQQISTAAARNIRQRVQRLSTTGQLSLVGLAGLPDEAFRSAGISPQKLRYLRDLIHRCETNQLPLSRLSRMSDEDVIAALTEVKGIGVWTAHMFLIFCLGRPDVLPTGDLGIQKAVAQLYFPEEADVRLATLAHFEEATQNWRPHASVASWYCWRFLDLNTGPDNEKNTAVYPV